jgi:hypothetical protein
LIETTGRSFAPRCLPAGCLDTWLAIAHPASWRRPRPGKPRCRLLCPAGTAKADVVTDAPTTAAAGYTVTLSANTSVTINGLTINGVNNLEGSNRAKYKAAAFELHGTLAFAPGSPARLADRRRPICTLAPALTQR